MIELLLQAERSLTVGQLDAAERLYRQVIASDPRNSIAVVGLARVTLDRGDERGAYRIAQEALTIDAENAAAQRLVSRLGEVMRHRGEELPEGTPAAGSATGDRATDTTGPPAAPIDRQDPGSAPTNRPPSGSVAVSVPARASAAPKRRGLLGRILGR